MSETKELLRRGVGDFEPTMDAFERVLVRHDRRQRNRRIGTAVVALVVAGVAIGGLLRSFITGQVPADDLRAPFIGAWVTTDADGSRATMIVGASGDVAIYVELHDGSAPACSGAPSTMTGAGDPGRYGTRHPRRRSHLR